MVALDVCVIGSANAKREEGIVKGTFSGRTSNDAVTFCGRSCASVMLRNVINFYPRPETLGPDFVKKSHFFEGVGEKSG